MRQTLYILAVLVVVISCENVSRENNSFNENIVEPTKVIDLEIDFNKWLKELDINRNHIIDTTKKKAFKLWSYKDKLTKSDSLLFWYPSKDSSYYLITNFNGKTKNRMSTEHYNDIYLRFLDTNSEDVYIGLALLDSAEQQRIDFYWYDSNTFFFIENPHENRDRILTKMKMNIDSIWTYTISISKPLDERSDG